MTRLQPGESTTFAAEVPVGAEIREFHALIHYEPFDDPVIVLAFLGGSIAFGWVIGWMLGALLA